MNYISLNKWALREGVNYSTSHKLYKDGKIAGAYEEQAGKLKKVKVPEDFHLPKSSNDVVCRVCGAKSSQITNTHLKKHGMTPDDYKAQFPDAVMIGDDVRSTIREKLTGIERDETFRQNVSKGRSGIVPKNHPRFVVGSYIHSNESKRKMVDSHTGILHTEESKAKIGDAHRGKAISEEAIEKQKTSIAVYFETHDAAFKGKTHTEENKAIFAENTRKRMNSLTPEERIAYSAKMSAGLTGLKRTPEQKERYSVARSKYMEEHWDKLKGPSEGEIQVREYFTSKGYKIKPQFRIPGTKHPYDVYVPELNLIVEFDGRHHWDFVWWRSKVGVEMQKMLLEAQRMKDEDETRVAIDKGYYIIRIFGCNFAGDSYHGTLDEQMEKGLSYIFEEDCVL